MKKHLFLALLCAPLVAIDWTSMPINNGSTLNQDFPPTVLLNDAGVAVAFWADEDSMMQPQLRSSYSVDSGASWSSPHLFTPLSSMTSLLSNDSTILTPNSSGNMAICWLEKSATDFFIKTSFFSPSSGWGSTQTLNSVTQGTPDTFSEANFQNLAMTTTSAAPFGKNR